ncbi:ABC transporter permease [Mahella australiensis]|uniref:Carbohydrate ABC transporter membrane protein 1, CUT1 family n=1 Tax=Mahella australiensis (strain DSM 15567 / CIP 107919 / 50-1 BON) TaxID=697281 RepID=F3ZWS5_MAHA5|nr:ABC transporter permease subunit [Mahella australiensis]AEE96518.1 carbohydrate ABC transporter membrane protein 1, CUT1 family [Mahella australiensis 50-1 BON]
MHENSLANKPITISKSKESKWSRFLKQLDLQSMIWPGLIVLIIFAYIPMYGVLIAFKDYNILDSSFIGILRAPWAGLKYFKEFFNSPDIVNVLTNTVAINIIGLIIGFPAPIIFALLLNEIANDKFKKFTQTVSYLPYFISWVIYGGLIINMLAPDGVVNGVLQRLGVIEDPVLFMGEPKYFWFIAVITGITKGLGWNAIIYLAAIAGVDPELYEAAIVDGAGRFKRMWYITLPSISGTIVILLILAISGMLGSNFDQIWMLQNPLNVSRSEVIDTYTYKMGLGSMRFSYATAVGLFRSAISVILLVTANYISKKLTEQSLF